MGPWKSGSCGQACSVSDPRAHMAGEALASARTKDNVIMSTPPNYGMQRPAPHAAADAERGCVARALKSRG